MKMEKQIEQRFVSEIRRHGGMCLKFVSPGMSGMPDRIVLLPHGNIAFVEVKAPGQKPRKLQIRQHARLRALGFCVYVLDSMEMIPDLIREIGGETDGISST